LHSLGAGWRLPRGRPASPCSPPGTRLPCAPMKKIFIGCGIVVLLLLGCIAFLAWRFWPQLQEFRHKTDAAVTRLNALTVAAPFDPAGITTLDTDRFARVLDVRAQICSDLNATTERL